MALDGYGGRRKGRRSGWVRRVWWRDVREMVVDGRCKCGVSDDEEVSDGQRRGSRRRERLMWIRTGGARGVRTAGWGSEMESDGTRGSRSSGEYDNIGRIALGSCLQPAHGQH